MLGSVALPMTSGFIGEFLLINSLFQYQALMGAVSGLTIILGAVYMLRTFQRSMSGEANSTIVGFADLTNHEKLVLYPVVILILLLGIYPMPLLNLSEASVESLLNIYSNISALGK